MKKFLLILFISFSLKSISQIVPNVSTLSLQEIMKGNEFIGQQPNSIEWSEDGKKIFFDWNPLNEPGKSTYEFTLGKTSNSIVKSSQIHPIYYDKNQSDFLINYYSFEGALVAYDKKTKKQTLIYQSANSISKIQRTNTENKVYFQQGNNLFCYNSTNGSILQISNFKKGERSETSTDSTFLSKEEEKLFLYIQEKNKTEKWFKENNKKQYKLPMEFYIGKETIENIQIDPNGRYICFRLSTYPNEKNTQVINYITEDGHSSSSIARSKVSDKDASHRLGIYSIGKDSIYFIDFSKLSDIRKKPLYLDDPLPYTSDRKIVMHSLQFAKRNELAVCDVRSYDNKDRWIVLIDLNKGTISEIEHQHDDAWIGGPGISSWNDSEGTLGWLLDDQTIYFQSEESGYSHLYSYSTVSKKTEKLTSGKWEVHQVALSIDGSKFYITANKTHPGNRDFYWYDIKSKSLIPILVKDGYHEITLSPDEKTLAIRYSYKNKPWELYVANNTLNPKITQVTHSTSKEFEAYNWREPEVVKIKASDGIEIYARLYKPLETNNKPAVIFVHGAGYLQNAHNYWSTYYREYMFHNLLADNGFTVLDIDYRASEGYGRDYRTAIYRNMGGRDLQDQLDGKNYLVKQHGVDSNRVGIYGGSYGGFITLMAMLKTPGNFTCGAALRSVTDWAHYNHEYTSNILNYPGTDPEAYRKSSPIYYANGLEGKLLMLHGMVDDNVQFQDVVRLSQRFIELGKHNWETAVFPVEAHGFVKSYSWYDEYRRIFELFYTELKMKN